MINYNEIYQSGEKTEDHRCNDEISTSIVVRELLSKAARKRRQQHQDNVPGPSQHTNVLPSSSLVQITEEKGVEEEVLIHDEVWYLEQAIAYLFLPTDLSSTDTTPSDSTTTQHDCVNSSVCSAPSSSSVGSTPGLDVGACFVVHTRLATWYHQQGCACRNDGANDSGKMKENAVIWFEKAQRCALIAVKMYHRVFVTNSHHNDNDEFHVTVTRSGHAFDPYEQLIQILRHLLSSPKQHGPDQDPSEDVITKLVYSKQTMKSLRNGQRMQGKLDITPVELICYGCIEEKVEDDQEVMVMVVPKMTAKERRREERRIKFGDRKIEQPNGGEGGDGHPP